jgi:hypothetical protein
LLWLAYQHDLCAKLFKRAPMGIEVALKGKDADLWSGIGHGE